MGPECRQVQIIGHEDGHPGLAVGAGNGHAVDTGLLDAGKRTDRFGYLGGRYIFTLPAEGIPDSVDEIEIALLVLAHQIAGPKPGISRLEHVAEYLFLGGLHAGVALEPAAHVQRVLENLADRFSGFVRSAANAESLLISDRLVFYDIESQNRKSTRLNSSHGYNSYALFCLKKKKQ